jgi:hypothetical protein
MYRTSLLGGGCWTAIGTMDTQEQNVSLLLCCVLVASLSLAPAPAPSPPETPDQEASDPREEAILRNIERYRDFRLERPLAEEIHDQAVAQELDPDLAFAVVATESSFQPGARSPVGALGLAQVMPATARWMRPGIGEQEMLDPAVNLKHHVAVERETERLAVREWHVLA